MKFLLLHSTVLWNKYQGNHWDTKFKPHSTFDFLLAQNFIFNNNNAHFLVPKNRTNKEITSPRTPWFYDMVFCGKLQKNTGAKATGFGARPTTQAPGSITR